MGILKCLPGYRDTLTGGAILSAEEINTAQPTKQHEVYFLLDKKILDFWNSNTYNNSNCTSLDGVLECILKKP